MKDKPFQHTFLYFPCPHIYDAFCVSFLLNEWGSGSKEKEPDAIWLTTIMRKGYTDDCVDCNQSEDRIVNADKSDGFVDMDC